MTPRQPPWSVVYGDGAANQYRLTRAAAEPDVGFEYVPVTPAQSSTGHYDGGPPRQRRIAADDPRLDELWRQVERLESDLPLHAPARSKGTGAFTVTTEAGSRRFIVERGPALGELEAVLAELRR